MEGVPGMSRMNMRWIGQELDNEESDMIIRKEND